MLRYIFEYIFQTVNHMKVHKHMILSKIMFCVILKAESKVHIFLATLTNQKSIMADLRLFFFFFYLKMFNEAVKIVTIIYQKLADILLFYQNHKKVVTFQVRIWKCLQYDDLISDFSFVLPNSLKIRS